jgi:hypothetical protein
MPVPNSTELHHTQATSITLPRRRFVVLVITLRVCLAQLLGMPRWTLAFVLFAFLAPTRPARRLLIAAIGLELVIGLCAAIHWFVPSPPF